MLGLVNYTRAADACKLNRSMGRYATWVWLLALQTAGFAHTIPDDVNVQMFAKAEGVRLHLLMRIPFDALADTVFPLRERGALDLPKLQPMLIDAANVWVANWIDVYENGSELPRPDVAGARVSLAADGAFRSYHVAWEQLNGPALRDDTEIYSRRAAFDVWLDYALRAASSKISIRSRLARLGGRVVTLLQVQAGESVRSFGYVGNPGVFDLAPNRLDAIGRFLPHGMTTLMTGSNYLLFLICTAMLAALPRFWLSLAAGSFASAAVSAWGFMPDGLWFPVLFESLTAAVVLYLALEVVFRKSSEAFQTSGVGFGLVLGLGFSVTLRRELQFAGDHAWVGIGAYALGLALAMALSLFVLTVLLRARMMAGPVRLIVAGLIAHTAWHRLLDRAAWLNNSQLQWPVADGPFVKNAFTLAAAVLATYFAVKFLRRQKAQPPTI